MDISIMFKNKKMNTDKMISFGFSKNNGGFDYKTDFLNGQFLLKVHITADGMITAKTIDKSTNDEYILHHIPSAQGKFVGTVKAEYERILDDIAEKCFEPDIFKSKYSQMVIEYIRSKYGDEFEFLWQPVSDNAAVRRKENKKWYAVLLIVSKAKLGFDENETVNILDLRIDPKIIENVVDGEKYFSGYHMNKKHWITICLDGSVPIEEIYKRIDSSYDIAGKK